MRLACPLAAFLRHSKRRPRAGAVDLDDDSDAVLCVIETHDADDIRTLSTLPVECGMPRQPTAPHYDNCRTVVVHAVHADGSFFSSNMRARLFRPAQFAARASGSTVTHTSSARTSTERSCAVGATGSRPGWSWLNVGILLLGIELIRRVRNRH